MAVDGDGERRGSVDVNIQDVDLSVSFSIKRNDVENFAIEIVMTGSHDAGKGKRQRQP